MEKIYGAIIAVMGDIGAIGKEKMNVQQKFKYRGIDDVMNVLNPAFIKHKLFAVPQVLEQQREERTTKQGSNLIYSVCRVKYTFYAEDGSHVEVVTIGEGMDSGDKATNKAMAIAFKYACFQLFCIPTEEMSGKNANASMVDPDGEVHAVSPKGQPAPQAPDAGQKISQDQLNDILRELDRTGVSWRSVCDRYGIDKLSDLPKCKYTSLTKDLNATKTKIKEPADIPAPEIATEPPESIQEPQESSRTPFK